MSDFRSIIRTAATILPEIQKPKRKPSFNERLLWTAMALAAFLAMAQTPLYGVPTGLDDPLAYTRIIFASTRGTLMELGIGPIVTAGLIMQLLKGADLIRLDFKKPEDRALFTSATKLLTVLVTIMEAGAFMAGGLFGTNLTPGTMVIIMGQLVMVGFLVMLLDELVQKGWGLGSGISLFIMASVAQQIMWNTFSIFPTTQGPFGAIPFAIESILAGDPGAAWLRGGGLPSILTLLLTLAAIVVMVYIEGIRIEIPITSSRFRGFQGVYPIKLLYTSVIPIILASALLANLTFIFQLLWSRFNPLNRNPFLNLLVTFDPTDPQAGPTGGLLYYMTTPRTLEGTLADPLRAMGYVLVLTAIAVLFAKIWVEIGGLSPKAAAKSLLDAEVQIPGFRRAEVSVYALLSRYIPTLTIISGVLIGLIAGLADILGLFGSGTGILLLVDIVMNYYNILMRERLETQMPRLAGLLGKT